MIKLTKGSTSIVYLTLKEKQTITNANFLFIFESWTTNEKRKYVILGSTDESNFKDRYNQFSIVVNTYFNKKEEGWYTYTIREQASTTNTSESLSGAIVETGLMFLTDGQDTASTKYNNTTTFKIYDAE